MSGLFPAAVSVAQGVFATLFPSDCAICGAPLVNISRLPVCEACLGSFARLSEWSCTICSERLPNEEVARQRGGICELCRRAQPPFAKAAAYGSYGGALRELIQLFKYAGVKPAAGVLGRMLGEVLLQLSQSSAQQAPMFAEQLPIVIPVPLFAGKRRERGFNQAEEIARVALKHFRAEHFLASRGEPLTLETRALARARDTRTQTGLTRHQRRQNMRGAFAVGNPELVRGRDVLLVDDVFTTGTTVSECARVLRRAGAKRVLVATVARVLKPDAAQMLTPEMRTKMEASNEKAWAANA